MIEDKELGLKVAENEEEDFYTRTKKGIEKEILSAKRTIEMNEVLLRYIETKLAK